MKPNPNRKRSAGHGFNAVEPHGYWVRYERGKSGDWWASFYGLPAVSAADTLKVLKRRVSEVVPVFLEEPENGWEMPKPDGMLSIDQVL